MRSPPFSAARPCWLTLDGAGEKVTGFDEALAQLSETMVGRPPTPGQLAGEVFGEGFVGTLRSALARAREEGRSPWVIYKHGLAQTYRAEVRFEPSWPGFDVSIAPVDAADAVDPDGLFAAALRQSVTEIICVVDRKLTLRAFNSLYAATAAVLVGRPPQVGDDARATVAPGTYGDWEARYARAFGGEPVLEDVTVTLRSGASRTYEVSINPIRDATGAVDGVLVISRNVTVRRDEAEDIRRAAEQRRAILEAMPEAVTVFARDGTVIDFKGARDVPLTEPTPSFVGKNVRDIETMPAHVFVDALARAFETRETERFEYELVVDGAVRVREGTVRTINDLEAASVVRDVTRQREASRRLAFADRMASLGTLAAGVAHELNNPLAHVTANVAFLREALSGRLDLEGEAALADAVEGLARMRSIVGSLGTFSAPQGDVRAAVDVGRVVAGAVRLAQPQLALRASVTTDLAAKAYARASETQLSQVFLNLLLNAAQALDGARRAENVVRVTLSVRRDGRACVEVADNGPGIPAALHDRIFEPFFTTKPIGEGTGLGLAISRQLVHAAGGEVELESQPGKGALFRVLLPAPPAAGVAGRLSTADRKGPRSAHPGARILLIDDDRAVRAGLVRLLSHWDVKAVADADAGIAALETQEFDLILCDVTMPGRSGVDFYVAVKGRWPGLEARVALMTGGVLTSGQRAALAGEPPVLQKPFEPSAIEQCLTQLRVQPR